MKLSFEPGMRLVMFFFSGKVSLLRMDDIEKKVCERGIYMLV